MPMRSVFGALLSANNIEMMVANGQWPMANGHALVSLGSGLAVGLGRQGRDKCTLGCESKRKDKDVYGTWRS
jgi:hypothetical protein